MEGHREGGAWKHPRALSVRLLWKEKDTEAVLVLLRGRTRRNVYFLLFFFLEGRKDRRFFSFVISFVDASFSFVLAVMGN